MTAVLRASVSSTALVLRSPPALFFFDEVDYPVTDRGFAGEDPGEGGTAGSAKARVLSTLLNEMDGIGGCPRSCPRLRVRGP